MHVQHLIIPSFLNCPPNLHPGRQCLVFLFISVFVFSLALVQGLMLHALLNGIEDFLLPDFCLAD